LIGGWRYSCGDPVEMVRTDLNPTAFDGDISRSWTIFPAFFRWSV
jgi:hypothetical protein